MPLYAGSTNVIYYTPRVDGVPVEALTMAVTATDEAGTAVDITASPAYDATYENDDGLLGGYSLVIAGDEIDASLGGQQLLFAWVWTYVVDGYTQQLTDYEYVEVVLGVTAGPNVTVGTNSYVTEAEAGEYMNARLGTSAWDSATEADRARALLMAARNIDALRIKGRKYTEDQTMEFPRLMWVTGGQSSIYSEEHERYTSITKSYGYYGDGEVPQRVKDAQCEEALELLKEQTQTSRFTLQQQNVTSVTIGDFSETYGKTASSASQANRIHSIECMALLRPFVGTSMSIR